MPLTHGSNMQANEGSVCSVQGDAIATDERRETWLETVAVSRYDIQSMAKESSKPSGSSTACWQPVTYMPYITVYFGLQGAPFSTVQCASIMFHGKRDHMADMLFRSAPAARCPLYCYTLLNTLIGVRFQKAMCH